MKLLILGGYGTFGGRLAFLLQNQPRLTLILAGRSLKKAARFCEALPGPATCIPQEFDRNGDVHTQLAVLRPDVVIDASGPFQSYGELPYAVVNACISLGIHYLDLADDPAFVEGVSQFDAEAKARAVFVLSGVSSFPVLTTAVVRFLAQDMRCVTAITGGVAPSPHAGVGMNVVRAVATYAGKPLARMRDGRMTTGYAFTESCRFTIAPPGEIPLQRLRFSLVEVPDLQALPALWPEAHSVWMGAAPLPATWHWLLTALAWLVRLRLLPSLQPASGLIHWAINKLVWGEHRGGMFVHVTGTGQDGRPAEKCWHLLAEGDEGRLIPSMAAEAVIRRCLAGTPPPPGARAATGDVEVADFMVQFAGRSISTGIRQPLRATATLYQRLLGSAWQGLPPAVQALHGGQGTLTATGAADIDRGRHPLARLGAVLFGFPPAGRAVPLRVTFAPDGKGETWTRDFNGKCFSSRQTMEQGRSEWLLHERFGVFAFGIALLVRDQRMQLVLRRWSFCGIPLPRWLAPQATSWETEEGGKFRFFVEITHRFCGLIVRYQGTLSVGKDT